MNRGGRANLNDPSRNVQAGTSQVAEPDGLSQLGHAEGSQSKWVEQTGMSKLG